MSQVSIGDEGENLFGAVAESVAAVAVADDGVVFGDCGFCFDDRVAADFNSAAN